MALVGAVDDNRSNDMLAYILIYVSFFVSCSHGCLETHDSTCVLVNLDFFLIRYYPISSTVSSERIKNTLQCSTLGIGWQKYSSGPPVHPMLLVVSSWASTLKIDSLPNFKSKKTVNKNKKRKKKHFIRSVSNGCEIDLSDFAESVMEQKRESMYFYDVNATTELSSQIFDQIIIKLSSFSIIIIIYRILDGSILGSVRIFKRNLNHHYEAMSHGLLLHILRSKYQQQLKSPVISKRMRKSESVISFLFVTIFLVRRR